MNACWDRQPYISKGQKAKVVLERRPLDASRIALTESISWRDLRTRGQAWTWAVWQVLVSWTSRLREPAVGESRSSTRTIDRFAGKRPAANR